MICPVCKEAMLILEYENIELDYCPACEGSWVDAGELELLLNTPTKILDLSELPQSTRSKRRCPRCRKRMRLTRLPESEVEVDICPRDGGIWLDKGELLEIARSRASSQNIKSVQKFFSALFIDKTDQKET
jgi:Zn-finger nucleic acid-binding protein